MTTLPPPTDSPATIIAAYLRELADERESEAGIEGRPNGAPAKGATAGRLAWAESARALRRLANHVAGLDVSTDDRLRYLSFHVVGNRFEPDEGTARLIGQYGRQRAATGADPDDEFLDKLARAVVNDHRVAVAALIAAPSPGADA